MSRQPLLQFKEDFIYVYECFARMYICTPHVCNACTVQKRALNYLEQELQWGSEQETKPSSCQSCKCSPLLSLLQLLTAEPPPAPHCWAPQNTSPAFLNEKQVKCTPSALWIRWKATTLSYGNENPISTMQQKQNLSHIWNLKFPSHYFKNIPVKVTLIFYILLIILLYIIFI